MMFARAAPVAMVIGGTLVVSSGTVTAPFCLYVFTLWAAIGSVYTLALRISPDLVQERMRPPSDRDQVSRRAALPLLLAHYAIAGLDARFDWSEVGLELQLASFALLLCGLGLAGWTVLSNPFASSAVRLQAERRQTVVSHGPYAIVRHPMYLGVILFTLASGAALGSWIAELVLLPLIAIFVRRTLVEERMLHQELDGYSDYAKRVRFRVIPGVF
jgi:protein-S-isoprenylcysteine O-methyltransferase Ste14